MRVSPLPHRRHHHREKIYFYIYLQEKFRIESSRNSRMNNNNFIYFYFFYFYIFLFASFQMNRLTSSATTTRAQRVVDMQSVEYRGSNVHTMDIFLRKIFVLLYVFIYMHIRIRNFLFFIPSADMYIVHVLYERYVWRENQKMVKG